jgi:hypothetical protein
VLAGLLAVIAVLLVLWTTMVDSPYGGRSTASAPIDATPAIADRAASVPLAAPPLRQSAPAQERRQEDKSTGSIPASEPKVEPGMTTITIIDGSSGKRRQISVPGSSTGAR